MRHVILIAVLALMPGCSKSPPKSAEQLQGQLNAAMGMSNISQRDRALAAVAEDAASASQGEIVLTALEKMSNVSERDATAKKAALKLAEQGHTDAATSVARKISNLSIRDDVLGRIAKG